MPAPFRADLASVAGLILAAGQSSRMGRDKALLSVQGQSFLRTSINLLHDAGLTRIAVVLGHHAGEIQQATDLTDVEVVFNPKHLNGQTSSLQAGLRALERPILDAIVLALVDHPMVRAATVQALVNNFLDLRAPVVVPTYRGKRGHPVVFSRALFEPLLDLDLSMGANTVFRKFRDSTLLVEVEDRGVLQDIDEPKALRAIGL